MPGRPLHTLVPAPLYVVLAILLLQVGSATAKDIMNPSNAMGLIFLRNLLGGTVLLAAIRPDIASLTRRQWINAVLLGANLAVLNSAGYFALNLIPLGMVMTIGFLGPLTVSVIGARRPVEFLWPVLAFAGVFLLTPAGGGSDLDPLGVALACGFALAWGTYILLSARNARTTPGLTGFCLAMCISAVLTAPFAASSVGDFLVSAEMVVSVLMVALFGTLPFALEFIALKRLSPAVFGVLLSTEPALASVVGMIMLGEILSGGGWTALVMVSVAALGSTLTARRIPPRP